MYAGYWQLKEKPFENAPDPRFLYHSQKHVEALSRIFYVIRERKGAALLTGEYGSGKTLISRVLLEELSSDKYQPALVFNPRLPSMELVKEIIYQLGGSPPPSSSKTDLLHLLNEILYKNRDDDKNTVILVDEAQAIEDENGFDELRLLLNFQLNNSFLLTLVLLGQPELREKINAMPQLRQRLAVRYHLSALTEDETNEYIHHRLEIGGSKEEIFTEDGIREVYRFSAGIPRRINNICDMALLVGYSMELNKIDRQIIREVSEDLEETPMDIDKAKKESVAADG